VKEIRAATVALAKELNVVGLMNVQFAVRWEPGLQKGQKGVRNLFDDGEDESARVRAGEKVPDTFLPLTSDLFPVLYVIEVNPRASRTVPFVAKATGLPAAKVAAKVMAGVSLAEQGVTEDPIPSHVSVKEAVFPFIKFAGVDIVLGPEMRSTGEVMGVSERFSMAFAKSQLAAGTVLPQVGNVFVSVADRHKPAIVGLARKLVELGFSIVSTSGTAASLESAGVPCRRLKKLLEGHPNLLDLMADKEVALVVNTPSGKGARTDEGKIRAAAVQAGVPCVTTVQAATAAVKAIEALREEEMQVQSLQERFPT
jgi:carbamoyl-phosphate synthase large subunit